MRYLITIIAALGVLAFGAPALAQTEAPNPTPPEQSQSEASWEGLPFSSLADFETKVPIGMTRRDLIGVLGRPEATTPGMGRDTVFHYAYTLADARSIRAVIVVRDGAVFIRRLYIQTSAPETGG